MSRVDRDKEIYLFFSRMSSSDSIQYEVMRDPQPGYYGQPYDLGSIMHYYPTVRHCSVTTDMLENTEKCMDIEGCNGSSG